MKTLFLGKKNDASTTRCAELLTQHIEGVEVILAATGEPDPLRDLQWQGDIIISYLWRYPVPARLLLAAAKHAINFHPGPPAYPGIGCTNFALYDGAQEFGVTCHHMEASVDSGEIIAVRRFPISGVPSVVELTHRCYVEMEKLFIELLLPIAGERPLPVSGECWTRKAYRREDLNALCKISADMPANEIARRVRAVTFPGAPGAYIDLHGFRFRHDGDSEDKSLA